MARHGGMRERGNLPAESTLFVGRERELAAVDALLGTERLVTLTGPGGVGKTRIALRAAARLGERMPQGVWLVELSPLLDEDLVGQAVANALGVADQTSRPLLDVLVDYLRDRELLLVMDTCEHLVEECGRLARLFLDAAPGLHILATSRQALGVPGERCLVVGPMDTGPDGDAPTLLRVRAWPETEPSAADDATTGPGPRELARLCALLDGIPLAIELAAPQLRTRPVEHLVERLTERMSVLSPDPEAGETDLLDRPFRHAGLRTTIGWSHEWCTPEERLLWARLSVFPGSFDIQAVDFVCTGEPLFGYDLTDVLNSLAAKSVVLREGSAGGRRYRMLDSIREYGAEWLERLGESRRLRLRHRDFYRHLAMLGDAEWVGPDQPRWQARMTAELPNVRMGLESCLETSADVATTMAGDLLFFWLCCGHIREGRRYLEAALAVDPAFEEGRPRALWSCALIAVTQGDLGTALQLAEQARELAERQGDDQAQAGAWYACAGVHTLLGDTDRALSAYAASYEKAERAGPALIRLLCLPSWGYVHMMRGETDEVRAKVGRLWELTEELGDIWAGSYGDFVLAHLSIAQGRYGEAIALLHSALEARWLLNDLYGMAVNLDAFAIAAVGEGRAELAARLIGLADRAWGLLGTPQTVPPVMVAEREACEARARKELGPATYRKHYLSGFAVESVRLGTEQVLRAQSQDA
ncbi:hypothetical protein P8605_01830 [Streptomyces sp. T-3]|nr:hypothetical protein [Streptomyces sp. T-3]